MVTITVVVVSTELSVVEVDVVSNKKSIIYIIKSKYSIGLNVISSANTLVNHPTIPDMKGMMA